VNGPTPNATSTVPGGERIAGLPDPVVIRQLYLGCLSQASYLVGDRSSGRAIAVDPRRDVDELLEAADEEGLTIELVVETHFHADFLSGHLELADATGAAIAVGAAGTTEFESRPLVDGEIISLGSVQVEVWATPGHTPESISLVVRPAAGAQPAAVLTGDTLFIGDVGRPDLLVAADVPAEYLGAQLYHSVRRLAALPDATVVLPAHGAGSSCGKALSSETVSTIGDQRTANYALAPMSKEQFVEIVTEGQPTAPAYFGHDAALNRKARPLFDETPLTPFDLARADAEVADGAVVVDVRPAIEFAAGHLAGSLGIALEGRFAEWVGSVVGPNTPIVLAGGFDDVSDVIGGVNALVAAGLGNAQSTA
jgi:glyoxylase-like metal-dependent hydrolase (beta-lactamase superfamily II)